MALTPDRIEPFIRNVPPLEAQAALDLVASMVKSYTRGAGFDDSGNPVEDLEALIVSMTLRFLSNPTGVTAEAMGGLSVNHGANHHAMTLLERLVADRYRVQAR